MPTPSACQDLNKLRSRGTMSGNESNPDQRHRKGQNFAPSGAALIFILVEPQMGENIGAAARAMLNFGITGLRLVAPRDGWPNPAAKAMAAGASAVIDGARVFETLAEAVADCTRVLATTARARELRLPVTTPRAAAADMMLQLRQNEGARCAVLFGGERSGLTSDQVAMADAILTIPVNPAFASLNLAQAVLVMAYEWGQAIAATDGGIDTFASPLAAEPPAPRAEFTRLMVHLETELEAAGFFHPPEKKPLMIRNLTAALTRAGLTRIEVQTLRGVIKALARGRGQQGRRG